MIFIKQITNEIGKKCVSLQVIKSYTTFVMTETDNNISDKKLRLTIRFSRNNMAFAVGDPQENGMLVYEPYEMNMGISVAANLREAFKVSELLQSGYKRLLAEIDTPVMLMPIDDFGTQDIETLYHHTYHRQGNEEILSSILPDLNAIAVFAINKDLKLVIDDHFKDNRLCSRYGRISIVVLMLVHVENFMLISMRSVWRFSVFNKTDSVSAIHTKQLMSMMLCIISFIYGS